MDPIFVSFIYIVLVLAIAGLILWAVGQFPIDATIQRLIRVVVIVGAVIFCIVWMLRLAGVSMPRAGG